MKKYYLRFLLFVLFFTQGVYGVLAQNNYILPQITPKSPEAAAFEKYTEMPVSLSNGTVNLSIPLYTIRSGSLEIPVTLSFNSNGVKTDEIPSYVGMGWSIQAGGAINYEQRGLNDYAYNDPSGIKIGLFSVIANIKPLDSLKKFLANKMSVTEAKSYLDKLAEKKYDGEPDYYSYSYPGGSGAFYPDTNQNWNVIPKSGLRVENIRGEFTFRLTDQNGTKWEYGAADLNESLEEFDPMATLRPEFTGSASVYLTKATTTDNRQIDFNYTYSPVIYKTDYGSLTVMSAKPNANCPDNNYSIGHTNIKLMNMMLESIVWDGGRIEFELSTTYRQDIYQLSLNYSSVPYLNKVKIYNNNNQLITEYTFNYTNGNRLRLDEVVRTDPGGNPAVWKFEYMSNSLPKLFSKAKDHWGYAANGSGIPSADYNSLINNWKTDLSNYIGGSRESSNASQAGLIQKVTFPTGGSSVFDYEPNSITYTSPSQLGDFMTRPFPTQNVVLVDENTNTQDEISGSFTLAAATEVDIWAYKWYQPIQRIDSWIYLANSSGGGNLIGQSPLIYNCVGTSCEIRQRITLPAGTYNYTIRKLLSDFQVDGYAKLDIEKVVFQPSFTYQVGGYRILSVKNNDSIGNSTMKRYRYTDRYDSVGYVNIPEYISKYNYNAAVPFSCLTCGIRQTITEESVAPLSGNPVEYIYVTEYSDDNGSNGMTTYSFTPNENRHSGRAPWLSPFKPNWKAGLLKNKKQYKWNGTSYELIQLDSTEYETIFVEEGKMTGLKAEYDQYCAYKPQATYSWQSPQWYSEIFHTSSQSQVYYSGGGKIHSGTESIYGSSKHTMPTEIRSLTSNGDTLKEKIKYSFDYDTTSVNGVEAQAIRYLQRKNIVVPIEKLSVRKTAGVELITHAILFTYKTDTAAIDRVFECPLPVPVAATGFTSSTISSGNFSKDSRYEESARFIQYDSKLNMLQTQSRGGFNKAYLWDYDQQYLVCEASGAVQSDIAFTSFETSYNGNWILTGGTFDSTFFITGRRCLNLGSGNLSKGSLTNGKKYVVSYWSRSGAKTVTGATGTVKTGLTINGWTYYEHQLTTNSATVTVTGTGFMDELRLYPADAQLATITYTPLVGINSQCDARNNVLYYEYDASNRLKLIRDKDRNIVKLFSYQYNTTAVSPANWVATGLTRCKPCPQNAAFNSTIQQREDRDNNPESITYNQTRWVDVGENSSCTSNAAWQNTATAVRCKKNTNSQNTGEKEQEQKDMNPCSATYNQIRWIVTGTNTTACPIPPACAMGSNCWAPSQKCINNVCQDGVKVYTGNFGYDARTHMYNCYYYYEFGDGSVSAIQDEWTYEMCSIN